MTEAPISPDSQYDLLERNAMLRGLATEQAVMIDQARQVAVDQEGWAHRLAEALTIALKYVTPPPWAHDADALDEAVALLASYRDTVGD